MKITSYLHDRRVKDIEKKRATTDPLAFRWRADGIPTLYAGVSQS